MARTVDDFLADAARWGEEMAALRAIALGCGFAEALKWGKPCFTRNGRNIAILQPFRDECRLMFFKGALLADPEGLLSSQGENTQAARVVRFRSLGEVRARAGGLRALLAEAAAVEEEGRPAAFPARQTPDLPEELRARLDADPALAEAFRALTPGRRRSHALHIAGARQAATRTARVERCVPEILAGRGWNERPGR